MTHRRISRGRRDDQQRVRAVAREIRGDAAEQEPVEQAVAPPRLRAVPDAYETAAAG